MAGLFLAAMYLLVYKVSHFQQKFSEIRKGKDKFLKNKYSVKRESFDIAITRTDLAWELLGRKGSNIEEFFDVVDW